MNELGLAHTVAFASDTCSAARAFTCKNVQPKVFFPNVLTRKPESISGLGVTSYFAGFPCQPWSLLRSRGRVGWRDPRAQVLMSCLKAVNTCRPAYAVLENVEGVLRYWREMSPLLLTQLPGYRIFAVRINPQQMGKGLRRPRVFIVCLRESCLLSTSWRVVKRVIAAVLWSVSSGAMKHPMSKFLLPKGHKCHLSIDRSTQQRKISKANLGPRAKKSSANLAPKAKANSVRKWVVKHQAARAKVRSLPPLRTASWLCKREAEVLQLREATMPRNTPVFALDVSQSIERAPLGFNVCFLTLPSCFPVCCFFG